MCGISGYVGGRNAPVVLFDMLERLEYRGYDSAGLAYISDKGIVVPKDKGKVSEVRSKLNPEKLSSNIGVAHTRWATHGEPSQVNAHPHLDCSGDFVVAHNGIIENYLELKLELSERGHKFKSETDSEVISHLIEEYYGGDFTEAFVKALGRLRGSYAVAAISSHDRDKILVARKESPLIIGLGDGENYVASDVPAFLPYTKNAIILDDLEYAVVTCEGVTVYSVESGGKLDKETQTIEWDVEEAEKGGYHHFMLKEIFEEPAAAANALRSEQELRKIAKELAKRKRICFVACGTAYHAGLVGKYVLESLGVPAEVVIGSEFRYSTVDTVDGDCGIVSISQSGETADTIASVKEAKKSKGAYIASIVNVVGSTLSRISDDTVYIHAGPEIAVASTKAYVGQVVAATALSLYTAFERGKLGEKELNSLISELRSTPDKIKKILDENNSGIRDLAEKYANTQTFFYIGRNVNYPTALEGALKLKEISYVHAEGYPAGELKHGPLALLEPGVVVLAIQDSDSLREKMDSNIQEVLARGADVVKVSSSAGDLRVPETHHLLSPIVNIVPLHLFSYYISVLKGIDPDKPRNLAKSVTVE